MKELFEGSSDLPVVNAALGVQERTVGDLLDQRMAESVRGLGSGSAQLNEGSRHEQCQVITEGGPGRHPLDDAGPEGPANHRGCLECPACAGRQPVEPRRQDLVHGLGDLRRNRALDGPDAVALEQCSRLAEGASQLLREQGIACGLFEDRVHDLGGHGPSELSRYECLCVDQLERLEVDP